MVSHSKTILLPKQAVINGVKVTLKIQMSMSSVLNTFYFLTDFYPHGILGTDIF